MCVCVCVYECEYVCMYVCVYTVRVYMCAFAYESTLSGVPVCEVCMCVCMCMYMCMYTNLMLFIGQNQ
jgi:hypothetical protein